MSIIVGPKYEDGTILDGMPNPLDQALDLVKFIGDNVMTRGEPIREFRTTSSIQWLLVEELISLGLVRAK